MSLEITRWSPRRKAELLAAVDSGNLSSEEASRYALSSEELAAWRDAVKAYGIPGLRSTRLQIYTPSRRRRS